MYDWTPSVETATRAEFFDDMDGARTNGDRADLVGDHADASATRSPKVTGLIARLEYRHDNSSENSFANNNFVTTGAIPPAYNGQHLWRGDDTLAANIIYAF